MIGVNFQTWNVHPANVRFWPPTRIRRNYRTNLMTWMIQWVELFKKLRFQVNFFFLFKLASFLKKENFVKIKFSLNEKKKIKLRNIREKGNIKFLCMGKLFIFFCENVMYYFSIFRKRMNLFNENDWCVEEKKS